MTTASHQPMLEGIRIVDLTSVVFGPYATQILADLGAEVIKVESPAGDTFRWSTKPAKSRGMSAGHIALNRGKQSIVLDLKQAEDREVLGGLLPKADVFIHNIRGDAMERLGFGYETVSAARPDIVYVHCVGFGSDGPYAGLQAYDDVIQAATGTTTLASRVDGDPRPRYLPSLIADKVAGLHAAYATLAAIVHRLRTGEGQFVEVPMLETFTQFMLKEHLAGLTFEPPVGDVCYNRQVDPDRQPFPTSDGWISLVPYTPQQYDLVFQVLGDPDFLDDERFATPLGRVLNNDLLYQGIAERTPARSTAAWVEAFRAVNVPVMAVRDIGDILEDPHLQAVDFFMRREHPTEGMVRETRQPISFSAWQTPEPTPAPTLGEHDARIRRLARDDDPTS